MLHYKQHKASKKTMGWLPMTPRVRCFGLKPPGRPRRPLPSATTAVSLLGRYPAVARASPPEVPATLRQIVPQGLKADWPHNSEDEVQET